MIKSDKLQQSVAQLQAHNSKPVVNNEYQDCVSVVDGTLGKVDGNSRLNATKINTFLSH